VGEIEREVGLVPRRGALYRHFASKDELLEAAVRSHLASVAAGRAQFAQPVSDDLRLKARALALWILGELDRQHDITRVLEREGARLESLRERFRSEVSEASYAAMAAILQSWLGADGDDPAADSQALAVHLLGALVNARRSTWTFGHPPAGMDDERIARSWADLCATVVTAQTTKA